MPTLEPSQFKVYGLPETDAPVTSLDFRQLIEALARQFYTTDPTNPTENRNGQPRVLADNPANIKFQVYLDGAYRTIAQNIQTGIAAPVKQIVQVPPASPLLSWVIDHNLGSQVVAQVFDSSFNLLTPIGVGATLPQELVYVGHVPQSVLTGFAGTQVLRNAIPMRFTGNVLRTFAVAAEAVPITGPPVGNIEFELSGAGGGMVGGVIDLASGAVLGGEIGGSTVTGNNAFTIGDTLQARSVVTTPPVSGALDIYIEAQRITAASGSYSLLQVNVNRIIVTHAVPTAGFVVLIG